MLLPLIGGSLLALSLPRQYYRIKSFEASGSVYAGLGVRFFKRFVSDGDYINRIARRSDPSYRVVSGEASILRVEAGTRWAESFHLAWLVLTLPSAAYALMLDISLMPYDEWLAFTFDHSVPKDRLKGIDWYWGLSFDVSDAAQLVRHVTRLCNEFPQLIEGYTLPQIDQGIWFVLGPCVDFGRYLRDEQVSRDARRSCVRSMYEVYAQFVSTSDVEEMETCFWMWWDILLEGFYFSDTDHFDEDTQEMENTILETLSRILQLDDLRTQEYALHGLGHLKHQKAREIVTQYIEEHGDNWTPDGRKWLEMCRNGTVM